MRTKTRDRMIDGALRLLAEKGLQRASFQEVTKATGTPRGSIYYHFPGGKSELVQEALVRDIEMITTAVDELPGDTPTQFLESVFDYWEQFLTDNECRLGCAIAAVVMGAEDDAQIEAARKAFDDLLGYVAKRLEAAGVEPAEADRLSRVTMAAIEGGTVMGRAAHDVTTYRVATRAVIDGLKPPA